MRGVSWGISWPLMRWAPGKQASDLHLVQYRRPTPIPGIFILGSVSRELFDFAAANLRRCGLCSVHAGRPPLVPLEPKSRATKRHRGLASPFPQFQISNPQFPSSLLPHTNSEPAFAGVRSPVLTAGFRGVLLGTWPCTLAFMEHVAGKFLLPHCLVRCFCRSQRRRLCVPANCASKGCLDPRSRPVRINIPPEWKPSPTAISTPFITAAKANTP